MSETNEQCCCIVNAHVLNLVPNFAELPAETSYFVDNYSFIDLKRNTQLREKEAMNFRMQRLGTGRRKNRKTTD
jgi:hypothetical protein